MARTLLIERVNTRIAGIQDKREKLLMIKANKLAVRFAHIGAALCITALLASAPASAAVAEGTSVRAERTALTSAELVLDTIERAQVWFTTGILLPPRTVQNVHRNDGGGAQPPRNNGPDIDTQFKGYDWDNVGDGSTS